MAFKPIRLVKAAVIISSGLTLTAMAIAPADARVAPARTSVSAKAKAKITVTPVKVGIQRASLPANNSFMLRNYWTDDCADLPNYGTVAPNTPVTQYNLCTTSESADNQDWHLAWTLRSTPDGASLFEIVNDKSSQCLDLPNYGANPPGTHVSVYPCASRPQDDNQEWYLEDVSENGIDLGTLVVNYQASPSFSWTGSQCLDVAGWAADGSDRVNGAPLTIYNCYNANWDDYGFDDHIWYAENATS